jgi:molybdate transport system substrate-binding protein
VPRSTGLAIWLALLLAVPAACGARGGSPVSLTVFAAASLRDALTEAGTVYSAETPGVSVTFSFDSSTALRTQIEQGAPADAFASADTTNPQALVDAGLAVGPVTVFARNRLAIVVPKGNPAGIRDPRDLARPGIRIVGAGEAVPVSRYVEACLSRLGGLPGYPSDYAARADANVVSREDNVRSALTKVELGEADAAFVYATDAAASGAVDQVPIPTEANVEATYGAVPTAASSHQAEAAGFVAWLAGPKGGAVLATYGFLAVTGP